jgi:aryl carrier-like protein
VEPRNALERQLLKLWFDVLGRSDLGVTDNVFLYGGDPLRADRVQDAVCKSGITIKRGEFYKNPTVAEQARIVDALGGTELAGGTDAVL